MEKMQRDCTVCGGSLMNSELICMKNVWSASLMDALIFESLNF